MRGTCDYVLLALSTGVGIFLGVSVAGAQTVTPFQILGHLKTLELVDAAGNHIADPAVPGADTFSAARIVVNGTSILVPKNLIVTMPAAYKTPQQLFAEATGPSKTNKVSGLALDDTPPPLAAFEVSVDGNIVCSPTCRYIAGLVSISQQSLNTSSGYIHQIDSDGVIHVGADPSVTTKQSGDARIRLNDPKVEGGPSGRYGLSNEQQFPSGNTTDPRYPDARFQVDQGNPTVHALTGYPMCVPRTGGDPECPLFNRPKDPTNSRFLTTFVMDSLPLQPGTRFGATPIAPCGEGPGKCRADKQAPLVVGDHITYSGTLAQDSTGMFMSAHTVVADVGIYTKPGVDPAYVSLEGLLIGTMGPVGPCGTTAECQDRIRVEGFTTDPSRTVSIYALDVAPGGTPTVRLLQPRAISQAVFGRFRYITQKNARILFGAAGDLRGATRELMARIDSPGPLADNSTVPAPPGPAVANGLTPGVYVAPIGEYIFPEPTAVQGGDLPQANFECLAFLSKGWTHPDTGAQINPLNPWPNTVAPQLKCQ